MKSFLLAAAVFAGVIAIPRTSLDAQGPAACPEADSACRLRGGRGQAEQVGHTDASGSACSPGGRFTAENVPLRELLRFAFQVQPFQIEGLPSWANSDRFDVTAKAEGDIPPTQPGQAGPIQFMMRTLLAERFGLVFHNETREMPISELVLARPDGKLGPKLEKSTTDCQALFAARRGGGPPPAPPAFGEKMQCGFRVGPGTIAGGASQISQLANFLSQNMGRTVVDKTGLAGNYDFEVTYTPDQMPNFNGAGRRPAPGIDPNGPSLGTAHPGAARAEARVAAGAGHDVHRRQGLATNSGLA